MHTRGTQQPLSVHAGGNNLLTQALLFFSLCPGVVEVLSEVLSPRRSLQSWSWLQVPLKNPVIGLIITKVSLARFAAGIQ